VPFYASWLNRIEAQFHALRYFALDGTDHARTVVCQSHCIADDSAWMRRSRRVLWQDVGPGAKRSLNM
jgi:hypothetical protein